MRGNRVLSWIAARPLTDPTLRAGVRALVVFVLAFVANPVMAVSSRISEDMLLTTWTAADGVPSGTDEVVQTEDGFTWFRSPIGLYRFDGQAFEAYASIPGMPPLPDTVSSIWGDPRGGLWLGYETGGVGLLRNGQLQNFGKEAGLPEKVGGEAFAREANGTLWTATSVGLFYSADSKHWTAATAQGLPETAVADVLVDRRGTIWAITEKGIFQKPANGQFSVYDPLPTTNGLVRNGSGDDTWMINVVAKKACRLRNDAPIACWTSPQAYDLAIDAKGVMWLGTTSTVLRIDSPDALDPADPDAMTHAGKFTDIYGNRTRFDLRGNLWIGDKAEVTRLRATAFHVTNSPSGALAAAPNGRMWVASHQKGLMKVGYPTAAELAAGRAFESVGGRLWLNPGSAAMADTVDGDSYAPKPLSVLTGKIVVLGRYPRAGTGVVRIDQDTDGFLWVASMPPTLVRTNGVVYEPLSLPTMKEAAVVRGVRRTSTGALWVGASRNDVPYFLYEDGQWNDYGGNAAMPRTPVAALDVAPDDSAYVGSNGGRIARLQKNQWQIFDKDAGVASGIISAITASGTHVWAASRNELQGKVGERFVSIRGKGGKPFLGVSGIVERKNGDLWLNGADGLSRIPAAEWKRALADPSYAVAFERYDRNDGLDESGLLNGPFPSLAEGTDGRLWFAMPTKVYWIDSTLPTAPAQPLTSAITRLSVDDTVYPPTQGMLLPKHTTRLQIGFTAPAQLVAARTVFRYRLDGVDAGWRTPTTQRTASYTNLRPGAYRFRVMASDTAGHWEGGETVLAFRIDAAFYQTTWFLAACIALGVLLLVFAYLARLRQVERNVRGQVNARVSERERIARDLHDTLLQGVQALIMRLHGLSLSLPDGDKLHAELDTAISRANAVLEEGRDRVQVLREPLPGGDLAKVLIAQGEELSAGAKGTAFDYEEAGAPRALTATTGDECLQIGRELLRNAFSHSGARQIRLLIEYAERGFSLSVSDDGSGISAEVLQRGGKAGHWGLLGMQERAHGIGGTLTVGNGPSGGAECHLLVPAKFAYCDRPTKK